MNERNRDKEEFREIREDGKKKEGNGKINK